MSSTFDLLFRTDDLSRWGDGVARNLTPAEVDLNFWILLEMILGLGENPALPKQISSITVTDNQMTIHLSDGVTTYGPFDLPVASFTWRGNWTPATPYIKFDLFNEANGLYMVVQNHTSNAAFDSADGSIAGHYYKLLIAYPVSFDIGFFFPGFPGTGIAATNPMFSYQAAHEFFLSAGLPGSVASVDAPFAAAKSFDIRHNGTVIGSVDFASGDTDGTFTFADDVQFSIGDKVKVIRPTSIDATATNLNVTLAATKGTLELASSS